MAASWMKEMQIKLKAYYFANSDDFNISDGNEKITFAESAGKAKQDFSMMTGIHFNNIRVNRMPWADKYGRIDKIPESDFFEHGWYFICNICGKEIETMDDFNNTEHGYTCSKCLTMATRSVNYGNY